MIAFSGSRLRVRLSSSMHSPCDEVVRPGPASRLRQLEAGLGRRPALQVVAVVLFDVDVDERRHRRRARPGPSAAARPPGRPTSPRRARRSSHKHLANRTGCAARVAETTGTTRGTPGCQAATMRATRSTVTPGWSPSATSTASALAAHLEAAPQRGGHPAPPAPVDHDVQAGVDGQAGLGADPPRVLAEDHHHAAVDRPRGAARPRPRAGCGPPTGSSIFGPPHPRRRAGGEDDGGELAARGDARSREDHGRGRTARIPRPRTHTAARRSAAILRRRGQRASSSALFRNTPARTPARIRDG